MKVSPEQFAESYKSASDIYKKIKVENVLTRVEKELTKAVEKNKNIKSVSDKPVSSICISCEYGEDINDLKAAAEKLEKLGFKAHVQVDNSNDSYSYGPDYLIISVKK